jgi:hypothetical protein
MQQQQQQRLLAGSQQQQVAGQRQRQLLPTVDDGSILVVPQQNGNTLANNSNIGSKALPMPQEDQQTPFAEQQDTSSLQQQQEGPAPYVLGTWAQRQFIMPLNKASQKADEAAAAAAAAAPGTSLAQPIPASGRWPSSGSSGHSRSGSNGSKASRGSGGAAAAANGDGDGADADNVSSAADGGQLAQVHGSNAAALAAAAAAAAAAVEDAVERNGRSSMCTDDEEEAVQQAAWRWRFAKRWQAEQTRPPAEHAASVGDGGMEEALQYLAACGENWHLARAASVDPASESRLLGTLGTPSLLSAELLVDESFSAHGSGRGGLLQSTGSDVLGSGCLSREASSAGMNGHHGHSRHGHHGAGRGGGEATQQVTGITKRAVQLLAAQSDINKAVTQR